MEIKSKQQLIYFFISLKDILLTQSNDFVEDLFVKQYNDNLQKLGKIWNLNLDPYMIKENEDRYVVSEDIEYIKIEGFISNTDSTTMFHPKREEKRYKKINLLFKLNQVLYIINEKIKENENI